MIKNLYNGGMKTTIEEFEKAEVVIPGLFQFAAEAKFMQAALAATKEGLIIYNDHAPDEKKGDELIYHPKMHVPMDNILLVLNDKLIENTDLGGLGRLGIIQKNDIDSFYFYYFKEDKKRVKRFCKFMKGFKIKTKNREVDINAE